MPSASGFCGVQMADCGVVGSITAVPGTGDPVLSRRTNVCGGSAVMGLLKVARIDVGAAAWLPCGDTVAVKAASMLNALRKSRAPCSGNPSMWVMGAAPVPTSWTLMVASLVRSTLAQLVGVNVITEALGPAGPIVPGIRLTMPPPQIGRA